MTASDDRGGLRERIAALVADLREAAAKGRMQCQRCVDKHLVIMADKYRQTAEAYAVCADRLDEALSAPEAPTAPPPTEAGQDSCSKCGSTDRNLRRWIWAVKVENRDHWCMDGWHQDSVAPTAAPAHSEALLWLSQMRQVEPAGSRTDRIFDVIEQALRGGQ